VQTHPISVIQNEVLSIVDFRQGGFSTTKDTKTTEVKQILCYVLFEISCKDQVMMGILRYSTHSSFYVVAWLFGGLSFDFQFTNTNRI